MERESQLRLVTFSKHSSRSRGLLIALALLGAEECVAAEPLAPNLFLQGSQNLISGQALLEIPIIRGKGGVLRARADMVSAGFSASPLAYGDESVFASRTPFPNVSQTQSTPKGVQSFTSPYAYRFTAYGKEYTAGYPPPMLALKPGQKLDLDITNQLAIAVGVPSDSLYETNFHTHGFHVSPLSMGDNIYPSINDAEGTQNAMRVRIPLPDDQPDGINWYHVHHHTQTNPQVYGGLAGFITVGNPLDPWPRYLPNGPRPLKQLYLMLSEVNLQKTDEAGKVAEPSGLTRLLPYGNTASMTQNLAQGQIQSNWQKRVNGQLTPVIRLRPGETQVWNLAATGAFGGYNVAITDGQLKNAWQATLLTLDGNTEGVKPLSMPLTADPSRMQDRVANTLIMSGNRLTMAVTAPKQPGTYYLIDGWGGNNDYLVYNNEQGYVILATVEVSGTPENRAAPVFAADTPDYSLFNAPVDKKRRFEFSIKPGANKDPEGFLINGQAFGSATMPQLQIGTVEEWTLVNVTTGTGQNINQANHPFHIHQGNFIVTAINDVPVDPNKVSHINSLNYITPRDTVNIPINGSVRIKFQVDDYPGKYVFHCHILKHEDQGMMSPVLAYGPKDGLRAVFGPVSSGSATQGLMNVIDGVGKPIRTSYPFGKEFKGGLSTADALGAAKYYSTYAVGMASEGFDVAVYGGKNQAQSARFRAFRPSSEHPGHGVSVALGDINGDGVPEVIVGSRQAGSAQLKLFTTGGKLLQTFDGLIPGDFPNGINVAAGDINSDNFDDVIVGAGEGHVPLVLALDGRAIAERQTPSVLLQFTAGGGATAGARVAVGYVAPGTRPSYLANILTTPESGPETGFVEVWNPYAVMQQHTGMVMHSESYPKALQQMARYQPFPGKTDPLAISTGYLGNPGIPQAFAWSSPSEVASTVIDLAGETQTNWLYLSP